MRDFAGLLQNVRQGMGDAPRRVRGRDRVRMPMWSWSDARFRIHRQDRDRVLRHGEIVWGALVQANNLLFKPGDKNHPGNVLFSRDPALAADPMALARAAGRVFETKGRKDQDPAARTVGDILANEMTAFRNLAAPRDLTGGATCYIADVMFERRHLPRRIVDGSLMPLIVHPETTATFIAPHWYWPDGLKELWG